MPNGTGWLSSLSGAAWFSESSTGHVLALWNWIALADLERPGLFASAEAHKLSAMRFSILPFAITRRGIS